MRLFIAAAALSATMLFPVHAAGLDDAAACLSKICADPNGNTCLKEGVHYKIIGKGGVDAFGKAEGDRQLAVDRGVSSGPFGDRVGECLASGFKQ